MRILPATLVLFAFLQTVSFAQTADGAISTSAGGGSATIQSLLADGYEIKSSSPNGNKFIVFMQKDKTAYACEFATVVNSRCRSFN